MMQNAYSLFDKKVEAYGNPFFMPNDAAAVRSVGDAAADRSTTLARHPADFSLYSIGSFDDSTGRLEPHEPRPIVEVLALIDTPKQETMI